MWYAIGILVMSIIGFILGLLTVATQLVLWERKAVQNKFITLNGKIYALTEYGKEGEDGDK